MVCTWLPSRNHLPCLPHLSKQSFKLDASFLLYYILDIRILLDSGADSCFIDITFAKQYSIPLIKLVQPIEVEVVDGRPISSGLITHQTVSLALRIGDHLENSSLLCNSFSFTSCDPGSLLAGTTQPIC